MAKQARQHTPPSQEANQGESQTISREGQGSVARDKGLDAAELAARIPGWGSDLDKKRRPAVPMEKTPPDGTGAHWQSPERQKPRIPILKSTEHADLTPVFGTSCPPRGVSGALRKQAYRKSEGRNSHWLMLLAADRIDVVEGIMRDLVHLRLPNPFKEAGLAAEWKHHGLRTRWQGPAGKRLQRQLLLATGVAGVAWLVLKRLKARA